MNKINQLNSDVVIYLADQGRLELLWVLSLWVLGLLCHPGHLWRQDMIKSAAQLSLIGS